jgi:hypothetical protein
MTTADYSAMDEALELLSGYGPDLSNGLTSHAPMAAESLCAMGRPDAVMPWLQRYRKGMLPRPPACERITRDNWRGAVSHFDRFADWSAFFDEELQRAPWPVVLNEWVGHLAPGICASAAHGVIRVGHAVRSLDAGASPLRLHELADGLGYWAAWYQELPTDLRSVGRALPPREAIHAVRVVPEEQRRFAGTIVSSLEALGEFPEFAPVIGLLDVSGDARVRLTELTDVFARVYLANVHNVLTAIVFVHGVTDLAALETMLPHLEAATARSALRYAWQASCGLYAAFGSGPTSAEEMEPPREDRDTLIDMAIAHGDEHAIKFTEACLRFDALAPSPAYRAAAHSAITILPRVSEAIASAK